MTKQRSFLSIGLVYTAGQILLQAISFILLPIYTSNLSVTEYGEFAITVTISDLIGFLLTMGIYSGYNRFYKEYDAEDRIRLRNTAFTFSLIAGGVQSVLLILPANAIARLVPDIPNFTSALAYMVISNLFLQICIVFQCDYYLEYWAKKIVAINLVKAFGSIILILYFLAFRKEGIEGIYKGQMIANTCLLLYFVIINIKTIKLVLDKTMLRKMLKFGAGLIPSSLAASMLNFSDRFFMAGYRGYNETGLYSIGYKFGMQIDPLFATPFRQVFTTYKYETWNDKEASKGFNDMFLKYHFLGGFFILCIAILSRMAIFVFTSAEYLMAYQIVPIILIAYFLYGETRFFNIGIELKNKTYLDSLILISGELINIGLNFLLIPALGMWGAALATVLSYIIILVLYSKISTRLYCIKYELKKPFISLAYVAVLYGLYFVFSVFSKTILLDLIPGILFPIVYILLCLVSGIIKHDELRSIIESLLNMFRLKQKGGNKMTETKTFVEINLREKWEFKGNTYATGTSFFGGELLKGMALASRFESTAPNNLADKLKEANGFFAVVQASENCIFAAVDRIKSIPIFYSLQCNKIYISDDPYWICAQIVTDIRDKQAETELLLTRYITGRDTLHEQIKQLQAGEYLLIDRTKDLDVQNITCRYYVFSHLNDHSKVEKEQFIAEHGEILERAFRRFAKWADGRPIVVPLSGGYDSRLIALMLKRIKYDNIYTFSFGKLDNPDARVSRQVAEKLNLPWIFVPYEPGFMYKMINSVEWKQYNRMADGLYCTCFDRDWPAVAQLKKDKLIPDNSIIVPGHSGDFIAGGHIRDGFAQKKTISENEFVDEILNKHYTMWRWNGIRETLRPELYKRIVGCTGISGDMDREKAIDAYEMWTWQEFESKYLVNGVRGYEFWGYDWWLPLWDKEIIEFWSRVPLEGRLEKKYYDDYVIRLYAEMAGISYKDALNRDDTLEGFEYYYANLLKHAKTLIRKTPIKPLAASIRNRLADMKPSLPIAETMEFDWEQSQGRMNRLLYNKLAPYMTNRSSSVTLQKLGYIDFADEDVSEDVISMLDQMKGKDRAL